MHLLYSSIVHLLEKREKKEQLENETESGKRIVIQC